jgi:hypothetical protein
MRLSEALAIEERRDECEHRTRDGSQEIGDHDGLAHERHDCIDDHFARREQEQVAVVDHVQAAVPNQPMQQPRVRHLHQRVARAGENERRLSQPPHLYQRG